VRIKEKKKTNLTRRIRRRLYFAKKSQTIREIVKFVVAKFIESKTSFHEWKMIVSKKRKIIADLKSKTFLESFSTSVRIAENNSITNSRDKSVWANVEIMNSKNMKKALSRNSMNRSRFVNESSSKLKNLNASIVVNTIIDFDFLWETKSFWSYYNTTFETKECARWFLCWSTATFRTLMSSLFKSFDETSSYQSRWTSIKATFIYFTDSTRIRKCVFTSTISWTRTIEMSNILRSTSAHWREKSTISMKIRTRYTFTMCTISRSSSTRHETVRSHFRRRNDLWLMRSRIITFCLKISIFLISSEAIRRNRRSMQQRISF
jgi:hypothetical protein